MGSANMQAFQLQEVQPFHQIFFDTFEKEEDVVNGPRIHLNFTPTSIVWDLSKSFFDCTKNTR